MAHGGIVGGWCSSAVAVTRVASQSDDDRSRWQSARRWIILVEERVGRVERFRSFSISAFRQQSAQVDPRYPNSEDTAGCNPDQYFGPSLDLPQVLSS